MHEEERAPDVFNSTQVNSKFFVGMNPQKDAEQKRALQSNMKRNQPRREVQKAERLEVGS